MNLGQLIDQFELVTDTGEGLEQLRKVILKLAVKGNLASNFSANGSASHLLEAIEEEKKRQKNEGLITRIPDVEHQTSWANDFCKYPDGWLVTKLGNVLNLEYGKSLPAKERNSNGSFPVYGSNGPMDYHDEYLVEGPCLVIGRKGSAGAINLTYKNCWPTDVTYFVKPTDSLNIKFSYYLLESLNLEELAKGIKPGLNRNEAYELIVGVPPLEYQNKIVQKIETLFSQVDELEQKVRQDRQVDERLQVAVLDDLQRAETQEASKQSWQRLTDHFEQIYRKPEHIDQLKQAILNEAVRGRLVRQSADPNDEPAEKLLERIKEEKQRLYEGGEIRKLRDLSKVSDEEIPYEVPDNWIWCRLGYLAGKVGSGKTPKGGSKNYVEDGIKFLRSQNVWNDGLDLDGVAKIPEETHEEMSNTKVRAKDLLLNITGASIGRCAIVPDDFDTGNVNQHVCIIRPIVKEMNRYMHQFMISPVAWDIVMAKQVGISREGLSKSKTLRFPFPLPPLEEQKRIADRVEELFIWCDDLKEKLSRSQQTDQRLLEALVNGNE